MQPSGPTSHKAHPFFVASGARATGALLLILLTGLGLAACGSSGQPSAEAAATRQNAKIYKQQRAEALELVSCARQHGINLPEPDAKNSVSTRGVNLKGRRRKAAINTCYHKVVTKAEKVQAAERAAEEAERKRRGEPPPKTAAQSSTQKAAAFAQEREQLMEVVHCARRHGLHLPDPDAHNNINPRGLNLRSPHNNTVMSGCFRQVVAKASREQQELAQEREAGPRRLGEEPTG